MRQRSLDLALAAALLAAAPAFSHGGHDHVLGTVSALDANHVEVKQKDGKTVSVLLGPDTKYLKGTAAATPADLKVGARVVIDTEHKGDDLQATEIRIGVAPRVEAPGKPPSPKP